MLKTIQAAILAIFTATVFTATVFTITTSMPSYADEVYVEVDEDGVPSFSDKSTKTSKTVEIQTPMTFESKNLVPDMPQRPKPPAKPKPPVYTLLVTDPPNDAAIRDNSGALTVTVSISPRLNIGHSAQLLMDGEVIRPLNGSGSVELANVDRGTHSFQVQVVDPAGEVISTGPASSISMLRHFIRKQAR